MIKNKKRKIKKNNKKRKNKRTKRKTLKNKKGGNPPAGIPKPDVAAGLYTQEFKGPWGNINVTPTTTEYINKNLLSANPPPGATTQYPGTIRQGNNTDTYVGIKDYVGTAKNSGPFTIKCTSKAGGKKKKKRRKSKKKKMKGGNEGNDYNEDSFLLNEDLIVSEIMLEIQPKEHEQEEGATGAFGEYDDDVEEEIKRRAEGIIWALSDSLEGQDPPQTVDGFFKNIYESDNNIYGTNDEWGTLEYNKKQQYIADVIASAVGILVNDSDHNANGDSRIMVETFEQIGMEGAINFIKGKKEEAETGNEGYNSDYEDDY